MEFFWAHGYEGTGMTALLEHMGIGRQSLYDTFGDKRSLFLEALNHYFRSKIGPAIALLRGPGSPMGNIRKMFELLESRLKLDTGQFGCMVGNSMSEFGPHDPEVAKLVSGYLATLEDAFADNLARARKQGELGSKLRPRDLARWMVNSIQGLALLSKCREPKEIRSVVRTTLAVLEGNS